MLLEAKNLWKTFGVGETCVNALKGVSLTVDAGDFIAIVGPSGSGKSTLLHLLGAMDTPNKGEVLLGEKSLKGFNNHQLTRLRLEKIGFIFQTFNLIPTLTALENVILPMRLIGVSKKAAKERSVKLLEKVRLKDRMSHYPSQLSGGQKQRVAIARALANNPALILADEPTGNLDSENSKATIEVLHALQARNHAVIMVTHDSELAKVANKTLTIKDGNIVN